jgi:hypothetical protein
LTMFDRPVELQKLGHTQMLPLTES